MSGKEESMNEADTATDPHSLPRDERGEFLLVERDLSACTNVKEEIPKLWAWINKALRKIAGKDDGTYKEIIEDIGKIKKEHPMAVTLHAASTGSEVDIKVGGEKHGCVFPGSEDVAMAAAQEYADRKYLGALYELQMKITSKMATYVGWDDDPTNHAMTADKLRDTYER